MENDEVKAAFAKAAAVAREYFDEARADLELCKAGSSATRSGGGAAGTRRMLDALTIERPDGRQHLFIGAIRDGKPSAAGIDLLYRTHAAITEAEILAGSPGERQPLLHTYNRILLCGRLLETAFQHILRLQAAPDAAQWILVSAGLRAQLDEGYTEAAARGALDACVVRYEADVQSAVSEVEALATDLDALRGFQKLLPSFRMPIWVVYRDGADARVVNNVWFPPELVSQARAKLSNQ